LTPVEALAAEYARDLFGAQHAYVQPHSGIDANLVAFWALLAAKVQVPALQRAAVGHVNDLSDEDWAQLCRALGDQRMLGMSLDAGGHLTHGFRPNISGKMFEQASYGTDPRTGLLDYDAVRARAREFRPLVLMAGYSAYPRLVDFVRLREIADEVGAVLVVDMAHFAGLVAGRVLTGEFDPVPHADVVTSTTHKSLRGPRGGLVLCTDEYASQVDRGCPMVLGGPMPHVMAAKAVAFAEARQPAFRDYAGQVVANARALADGLLRRGARLVTGGTDNHLVLLDASAQGLTGRQGRECAARRWRRHQPQRRTAGPERRLVHLRCAPGHARADHPRAGGGGDGRGRRDGDDRAGAHAARRRLARPLPPARPRGRAGPSPGSRLAGRAPALPRPGAVGGIGSGTGPGQAANEPGPDVVSASREVCMLDAKRLQVQPWTSQLRRRDMDHAGSLPPRVTDHAFDRWMAAPPTEQNVPDDEHLAGGAPRALDDSRVGVMLTGW